MSFPKILPWKFANKILLQKDFIAQQISLLQIAFSYSTFHFSIKSCNLAKIIFIWVKFKVFQSKSLLCVGSVINPVLDLDVTLAYMVYSCLVPVYSCIFLYVFQLLFLNIRESEVIPSTDQAPFSDVSFRFEFLNFIKMSFFIQYYLINDV